MLEEKNNEILENLPILFSVISLLFSIISITISRKRYNLSLAEYENKQSNFETYIINSYYKDSGLKRGIIVNFSITNKSQFKNSLNAQLVLNSINQHNEKVSMNFEHCPEKLDSYNIENTKFFHNNIKIDSKEKLTNNVFFEIPKSILNENKSFEYFLNIEDINEKNIKKNISILKEYLNEI